MSRSLPRLCLEMAQRTGVVSRQRMWRIWATAIAAQALPRERRRQVQIAAFVRAFAGCTPDEVDCLVDAVMPDALKSLKPAMLDRLRAHQHAGLPLVLVSAGMHPAIARLAAELGGRGEGTRLVLRDGRYTAELDGPICQGEGKAARVRQKLDELGCDPADCYAYGDGGSDIPFLALVGHPRAVDPDRALAAEARRRGWLVLPGESKPASRPAIDGISPFKGGSAAQRAAGG